MHIHGLGQSLRDNARSRVKTPLLIWGIVLAVIAIVIVGGRAGIVTAR